MEYIDLTPYAYFVSPIPMRSLGWLGSEQGIQGADRRPMSEDDLQRLYAASSRIVSRTLGFHECEFCEGETAFDGNGEYHYYLSNGDVYSAPVMILHYVGEHAYRLPEEFREALRATTELSWDDRAERLCEVLADESQDFDLRCHAITDLPQWRDPRAYHALLRALTDEELVDCTGDEIGRSLMAFADRGFATGLDPTGLPDMVKFGMGLLS